MSRSEGGQSLISAIISVAIAAATILVILTIQDISTRQQNQSNFTFQADSLRRNLQNTINNVGAWQLTIAASENSPPYTQAGANFTVPPASNAGLNCFVGPGSNCTDASNNPILNAPINLIRDASGTVIYDTFVNNGFTIQGTPCNTYVAPPAAGTDACPLSYKITWSAICGATCTGSTAAPQISVVPTYNPSPTNKSRLMFNPGNYSATFKQGSDGTTCWAYAGGLLMDTCSGNVGIGTASPSSILDVESSTATPTTYILNVSARGDNGIGVNLATILAPDLATNGDTNSFWVGKTMANSQAAAFGYRYNTTLANSGAYIINYGDSVGTGLFVQKGGNVGIGTSTPGAKLDVNGGIRPGSSGVSTGGGCSPEGTLGYDMTAHAPVYCSNAGTWAQVGSVPSGTLMLQPIAGCPPGWSNGSVPVSVSTDVGGGTLYPGSGTAAPVCVKN